MTEALALLASVVFALCIHVVALYRRLRELHEMLDRSARYSAEMGNALIGSVAQLAKAIDILEQRK